MSSVKVAVLAAGRWRGLKFHVGRHRGKDSHQTSVRLLTEGDPEHPAALLVWRSLYSGDTLRFISAIQSIDRLYVYTVN